MIEIMIMEIVAVTAFLFSLFFLLVQLSPLQGLIMFCWTVLATSLYAVARRKKLKGYSLCGPLLFLPAIFYRDVVTIIFALTIGVVMIRYTGLFLLKGRHHEYANNLKRSAFVYAPLMVASAVLDGFSGSVANGAPMMLLYLVTSIFLIRSIRHLDYKMDMKWMRWANIRYLAVVFATFVLVALVDMRTLVFSLTDASFNFLFRMVYLVTIFFGWLAGLLFRGELDPDDINQNPTETPDPETPELTDTENIQKFFDDYIPLELLEKVLGVVLLAAAIFILFKLLSKTGERESGVLEYQEEREFMPRTKRQNKKKGIVWDKYPSTLKEQVRYYYRRYLKLVRSKDVDIANSDTSQEINTKAQPFFAAQIEAIRAIYIESRYGDKDVDKETVAEIKKLYSEL